MESLKGLKVAMLVENGFEQVELVEPRKALTSQALKPKSFPPRTSWFAPGSSRNGETPCQGTWLLTKPIQRTSMPCFFPVG
jgi:hypothetical protein